jgi:hypothetical protein
MIAEIEIAQATSTTAEDLRASGWSESLVECFEKNFDSQIQGNGE